MAEAPKITRGDVTAFSKAQKTVIAEAQRELGMIWRETEGMDPARRRDVLIDLTQALVRKYGAADSTVAAEWYERLRARYFDDDFDATLYEQDLAADRTLRQVIRARANLLFPDDPKYDPEGYLKYLSGVVERGVHGHGRMTVFKNVKRDHSGVRYARVPQGSYTCNFCFMLASRGFAYRSEETAASKAHDGDDCEAVPQFKKGTAEIKGYDPEKMGDMWDEAVKSLGDYDGSAKGRTNQIFAVLRQQHPDLFKDSDGHVH